MPRDEDDKQSNEQSRQIGVAEIEKAAKSLREAKIAHDHSSLEESLEYDQTLVSKMSKLYEECNGDLRAIFGNLDENPRKALKHPPKDANEFGIKYSQGFYSVVESK